MKTRILALLCLLAVFLGVFSLAVLPAKATEVTYNVGYSKKDMNPWVDPEDHDKGIILPDKDAEGNYIIDANGNYKDCIPLAGYGNTQARPALGMLNDNGDTATDGKDGLFTTCTAVTDSNGTTILFVTMDLVSVDGNIAILLRHDILSALQEEEDVTISADQIMITTSHNHTGPDLSALYEAKDPASNQYKYFQYIRQQVAAAAVAAYQDQAPATMTKTTFDASEAVSEKYSTTVQLTTVRHYDMTGSLQYTDGTNILDETENANMICGANFGRYHKNAPWKETLFEEETGGNTYTYQMSVTKQQPVATADNTMDLLKFEVDGKDPIVLINWQTHTDNVGGNNVSSDYIGGLRHRLETNKSFGGESNYRVAFFQGASGNLATRNAVGENSWTGLTVSGLLNNIVTGKDIPFVKYGYLLAEAALSALEGSFATWSDSLTGPIRHKQIAYAEDHQVYSDGLCAAAAAWQAAAAEAVAAGNAAPSFPYAYDYEGERYILSSEYHVNKIVAQTEESAHTTWTLELNAIFLGDGLAMVTAPNELFDRYNSDGLYKDGAYNAWNKLVGETYGAPMILGYTNGHMGYIPNKAAYSYNENATVNGKPVLPTASYEAATSNFPVGTGEKLMDIYAQLLTETATGDETTGTPGYCDKCGRDVTWQTLDSTSFCSNDNTNLTASNYLSTGHYRLAGDITVKGIVSIIPGSQVCLDLNGCTLQQDDSYWEKQLLVVNNRVLCDTVKLNILDSQGGGKLAAPNRVVYVNGKSTVNMYGGTLEPTAEINLNSKGGALYVTHNDAVFNLYGGTIKGSTLSNGTTYGGAVYLWTDAGEANPAQFNIYGGTVYGGTAKFGAAIACLQSDLRLHGGTILSGTLANVNGAYGKCIYFSHGAPETLSLSGNGYVDNILITNSSNVTITLTDDCHIRIPESINIPNENITLGAASGQFLSAVKVTGSEGSAPRYLSVSNSMVTLSATAPTFSALWQGEATTLDAAVSDYTLPDKDANVQAIILTNDVESLTVNKNVCIDLAGHSIGSVSVEGDATLYVMDSVTDALNTPDLRCCGSIGSVTGNVQPVPGSFGCVAPKGDGWYSGYVAVTTNGAKSFHRLDFGITGTETSPEKVGIRYTSGFYADSFACDAFTGSYGIVVSAKNSVPELGADGAAATSFSTMQQGGNLKNASYITNILRKENGISANKRNGETTIYGRAYFQFDENSPVCYGPVATTSLRETLTQIENNWGDNTLQSLKEQVYDLYNDFKSVLKKWNLNVIKTAAEADEEDVLKVLTIGNSHSVDAMTMLYEVYQKENPGKKVELGILYYSGCQIDRHILHIQNDYPAYVYYKINNEIMAETGKWQQNGSLTTVKKLPDWQDMDNVVISSVYNKDNPVTENTELAIDCWTIDMALADEKWDVIVLQQMNNYASDEYWYTRKAYSNNLTDLEWLIRHIKLNAQGAPKLGFHVTWANPMTDSNKSGYINTTSVPDWKNNMEKWYGNNNGNWEDENRITMQHTMFAKIRTCTQKYIQPLAENGTFDYVFFSGAAVQHAFDNAIKTDTAVTANENIYRDYTHMSHYGRLLVAYTWYAELEGIASLNEVKVDTIPAAILHPHDKSTLDLAGSVYNKQLLMNAVNYAINYNYDLPWEN